MALQKTEAIVLKSYKLGETSKILSLYSRKDGRLKLVAKGARGLKSHFYGSLETLNHISLVYYHKENRDVQLLSQADIIHSFRTIRSDLDRFSLASIATEIVLKSQFAEEANTGLFKTMLEYLAYLNDRRNPAENLFLWFELQYLKNTGFEPKFDNCLVCERSLSQRQYLFSIPKGGYICDSCRGSDDTGVVISAQSLDFMKDSIEREIEPASQLQHSGYVVKESSSVMLKFMEYHIPGLNHMKSVNFLELLKL